MKRILPFVCGILVTAVVIGVGFFVSRSPWENSETNPIEDLWSDGSPIFLTPFSGDLPALPPPITVIIENHLLARPFQQGLSKANVVYEAPAEAGITRFLAVFLPGTYRGKIGPIRSARTYFLDWAHEYNGIFAHVGGRFDAIKRLWKEDIFNADQYMYENYFWRENLGKTDLEHTMFSTAETLEKLGYDNRWEWSVPKRFHGMFSLVQPVKWDTLPEAHSIDIDYGYSSYQVSYIYNEASERYERLQAKKPHIDQVDGSQIAPRVVVVQTVRAWSNNHPDASITIKTIDEGPVTIFYRGRVLKGRWRKETGVKSPTRFYTEEGYEIELPANPVWIEVLPEYNSVELK